MIGLFNFSIKRILIYFEKVLMCVGTFQRSIFNIAVTVENSEHGYVYYKTLRGFAPVLYAGFCFSTLFTTLSRSIISNVTLKSRFGV